MRGEGGVCKMYMCLSRGWVECMGRLSVFGLRWCWGEWVDGLVQYLGSCSGFMYVCVVSLDSLWRWQA